MMKKRIFIAMHYLEIGGAETSLIGLLQSFDYQKYDVDLFLYSHRGEMMNYIPKEVNLLQEEKAYTYIESPIKDAFKAGQFGIVCGRLWAKFQFSRYAKKYQVTNDAAIFQYVQDAVSPFLPSLKKYGEYDLAISFLSPHRIVLDKVKAKKKIAWIHTDYSKITIDVQRELPVWQGYDYIASISDEVSNAFLMVFPTLRNKLVVIENILSKAMTLGRATEQNVKFLTEKDSVILLSIGRFSYAKNYDNVPDICKRIREKGINVYWYIIGYGCDEALIKQKIQDAGMKDYVLLLGKKENPYPYIKACDFYVQPSRFEGKSVTVREAQILCKPVIITDYPTAKSQIQDGMDGVIVPLQNEECANQIIEFINDKKKQDSIISYLKKHDYTNDKYINKLYQLLK